MALHLIVSGLLKFLDSHVLDEFLNISVQFLNFAVLLSYPINFFIYCRMSRAFRDAFTQLLCPSINRPRRERIPSTAAALQLTIKPSNANDNNNHHHFELNNTSIAMKNDDVEILPSSTVILNATTAETPLSLTPSTTHQLKNNNGKKSSVTSLGKQRVLFRDDVNASTNTKFTDL